MLPKKGSRYLEEITTVVELLARLHMTLTAVAPQDCAVVLQGPRVVQA